MNLHYVAGLLDGEGCIGFMKIRTVVVPRVSITNTNYEIIQDLYNKFGGSIRKQTRVKDHWKEAYHWVVTSRLAITFIESMIDRLHIKFNQALCVIAYESIRPGKGYKWSKDGIEARDLILNQLRWLNKKGVNDEIEPMTAALLESIK